MLASARPADRPLPRIARARGRTEPAALLVALVLAAASFLWLHDREGPLAAPSAGLPGLPTQLPPLGFGWWSYWDQWHYLQAVLAWAGGQLDPAWHWYLPGYPLLGAAFASLTPADPFLIPDLACLLGALWLFAGIAGRLLPGVPGGRAIGAALFLATAVLPGSVLHAWVEPWTTTPQTVGLYACLLATLRCLARPNARDAFLAGLAGAAVFGFRPADAVVVCGAAVAMLPRRQWGFFIAGAAVPVAVFAVAHVAVFGLHPGAYVTLSGQIGFEWRLLPMRWVLLMLDPRPLLSDGQGLIGAFPWIAPGLAGMAAALASPPRGQRAGHVLVVGVSAAELVLMLCYRDLHPTELWRFELYHYFVWLLPIAALYAVVLLRLLWLRRWLAGGVALAVVPALFLWRPELADPRPLPPPVDGAIALPAGLPRTDLALLVRAETDWDHADNDAGTLEQAGRRSERLSDLKGYPLAGGFLVVPLRRLPAAAGRFLVNPALRLDTAAAPLLVRQRIVWGLPCLVWADRPECGQEALLPPPLLPDGRAISFAADGEAARWLGGGWSHQEPTGRWTDGDAAVLRFSLPPRAGDVGVALQAHGYAPGGAPTRVQVFANGRRIARWAVGNATQALAAEIPAAALGSGRAVTLRLAIDDPRRPHDHGGGADARRLGLFVTGLSIGASEAAAGEPISPP